MYDQTIEHVKIVKLNIFYKLHERDICLVEHNDHEYFRNFRNLNKRNQISERLTTLLIFNQRLLVIHILFNIYNVKTNQTAPFFFERKTQYLTVTT